MKFTRHYSTGVGSEVSVKAAGCVRTLDGLLKVKEMGVARLGTSATATIMEDAYRCFGLVAADAPTEPTPESEGY
jgi:deoxyribose-phosphate aldolase